MYLQKEHFDTIDLSQNMLTPSIMNSVVDLNTKTYFSPCDIVLSDGSKFRFQVGDKVLDWYAVPGNTSSCSVDVSNPELEAKASSCSSQNTALYDTSIVRSINWNDNGESGKTCVVSFKPDVTKAQMEAYLSRLPSFREILAQPGSYTNAFNQSIKLIPAGQMFKVNIPRSFHEQLYNQPINNMARTVCFWFKLWKIMPNWRLIASIGDGEWAERKPAIYVSPGDSWLHFTTLVNKEWQTYTNSPMKIGYDNCFVTCKIYKDVITQKYLMSSKVTRFDDNGNEYVDLQTTPLNDTPLLAESLNPNTNRFLKFGNSSGDSGNFSIWDYRVYAKNLSDAELYSIKDSGKDKILYKSLSGMRVPKYYIVNTHMNRYYINDMIVHPGNANSSHGMVGNDGFIKDVQSGQIKYICVPQEPQRIYKIQTTRFPWGSDSWFFIQLIDIDINGVPTNHPISAKMLFNPDNSDNWQFVFTKMVIGLKDIPENFTTGTWLSDIYPTSI